MIEATAQRSLMSVLFEALQSKYIEIHWHYPKLKDVYTDKIIIVQQVQEIRTSLKTTTEKSISISTKEHTIPMIQATTPRSLIPVLFDAPSKEIQFHFTDLKVISTAKTTKDSVTAKQNNPQHLEQKKSSLNDFGKSYMDYKKLKDWGP